MKNIIETERFFLRELELSDAEDLFLLDKNPEVMKYVGQPILSDVSETVKNIKNIRKQYQENGIGRWAVIRKSDDKFTGWCGLKIIKEMNNHFNFAELGYRFSPEFWGKGFATETAKASLSYGFNNLKMTELFAVADVENSASNHVLLKLGFKENGSFEDNGDLCYWYELNKENFK